MSSQLLKQSASGGASDVFVSNDLVVAGNETVNGDLGAVGKVTGQQALSLVTSNAAGSFSTILPSLYTAGYSDPGLPAAGANNIYVYWTGSALYTKPFSTLAAGQSFSVVLPEDMLTNPAYIGRTVLKANYQNTGVGGGFIVKLYKWSSRALGPTGGVQNTDWIGVGYTAGANGTASVEALALGPFSASGGTPTPFGAVVTGIIGDALGCTIQSGGY